ncbi:MrpF/PhaF family protein [Streptomyces sp. NPDC049954]|uniref:MrpF/PhaF family protein n=1 Tax=Streptomyces sp. NPDC049954 TaxID=3155779 RepID=UPI00343B2E8D
MNTWLALAAALLVLGLGPAVWGVASGSLRRRVVSQNLATTTAGLVLLLLAQGYGRPTYTDLALVLSVLGPTGTLVYARLLTERLRPGPPGAWLTTVLPALAIAAVVLALVVATGPGRAAAKLLVIGVLLVVGNSLASRALVSGIGGEANTATGTGTGGRHG